MNECRYVFFKDILPYGMFRVITFHDHREFFLVESVMNDMTFLTEEKYIRDASEQEISEWVTRRLQGHDY